MYISISSPWHNILHRTIYHQELKIHNQSSSERDQDYPVILGYSIPVHWDSGSLRPESEAGMNECLRVFVLSLMCGWSCGGRLVVSNLVRGGVHVCIHYTYIHIILGTIDKELYPSTMYLFKYVTIYLFNYPALKYLALSLLYFALSLSLSLPKSLALALNYLALSLSTISLSRSLALNYLALSRSLSL